MAPNILKRHAGLISAFVRLFDVIITAVAGCAAFAFKFAFNTPLPQDYIIAILLGCVATIIIFNLLGFYEATRGRSIFAIFRQVIIAWLLLMLTLSLIAFFSKTGIQFSRVWFFEWMFLGCLISLLLRSLMIILLRLFRRVGYNTRSIAIIGSGALGQMVYRRLCKGRGAGYRVVCFLDRAGRAKQAAVDGIEVKPLPESLGQWIAEKGIDEIWIALPLRSLVVIKDMLHQLRFSTTTIKVVPDIFELGLLNHSVMEVAGMPVINIRSTPMEGLNILLKSLEDKLLSSVILILTSPFFLIIALAVKLSSPGPIFYRQERMSWNNKTFMMLKFRSMPLNAESKTGAVWAQPGEMRATKIGAFLRKTSLDELPQFINVLKGDMSIVGPRPERPVFVEQFKKDIPGYMQKHMVKAGITGWAQINGWRGSTDLNKRIEYDLYYIENWSLWFDLKIIFLTIFKGFVNKNAY